jgi:glycosyltransferase involved in cell wall biosynthesis
MEKNILYICSGRGFNSNRLPRKIKEIVSCWRKLGYFVNVLCGDDIKNNNKKAESPDINVYYKKWYRSFPLLKIFSNSFSEILDIIHDKELVKHIECMFKEYEPDLIWERSSRLHISSLLFAKRFKIPYVLEWKDHLINYRVSLLKKLAEYIEERKLGGAGIIVVESEILKDGFIKQGLPDEKIYVAYNGVNINEFKFNLEARIKIRSEMNFDDSDIIVGYVGSFAFYHDSIRIILAANLINKIHTNRKIKFVTYGKGKDYEKCRKLAISLGLLNKLIYMQPPVSQNIVPQILSSFDIAILPGSTDIICPIKISEYMSCSLPIILPDYKCNREIIDEGIEGLFFNPGDEDSLAERIILLANNDELRSSMGKRARKKAIEKLTWEKTWGVTLNKINYDLSNKNK